MKPNFLTGAICMIALFSVDLAYGYHPVSPYACCMENPVKLVEREYSMSGSLIPKNQSSMKAETCLTPR